MSGVDVSTDIVIDRDRDRVANFAANPDNVPAWYVSIESVEWMTARPFSVGSRIAFVARFMGRRLSYTYEIVELVPGQRLVMRTAEGPFPMETSYTWHAVSDTSTRMTLRNRGRPAGFAAFLTPFMSMMIRRANRKDLALLKHVLESDGNRDGNA